MRSCIHETSFFLNWHQVHFPAPSPSVTCFANCSLVLIKLYSCFIDYLISCKACTFRMFRTWMDFINGWQRIVLDLLWQFLVLLISVIPWLRTANLVEKGTAALPNHRGQCAITNVCWSLSVNVLWVVGTISACGDPEIQFVLNKMGAGTLDSASNVCRVCPL